MSKSVKNTDPKPFHLGEFLCGAASLALLLSVAGGWMVYAYGSLSGCQAMTVLDVICFLNH